MISRIDIYDYIARAVDTEERPVYCSARPETVPESFPACYIVQTNDASDPRFYTLDFTDEQRRVDFEVNVYSNLEQGALIEAESIMEDVRAAFRRLYFIENTVMRAENIDPAVIRLVGRFHRIVCGGDDMPEEETAEEINESENEE